MRSLNNKMKEIMTTLKTLAALAAFALVAAVVLGAGCAWVAFHTGAGKNSIKNLDFFYIFAVSHRKDYA